MRWPRSTGTKKPTRPPGPGHPAAVGARYVMALTELAPTQQDRLDQAVARVIDELDPAPETFYGRNRIVLEKLGVALKHGSLRRCMTPAWTERWPGWTRSARSCPQPRRNARSAGTCCDDQALRAERLRGEGDSVLASRYIALGGAAWRSGASRRTTDYSFLRIIFWSTGPRGKSGSPEYSVGTVVGSSSSASLRCSADSSEYN